MPGLDEHRTAVDAALSSDWDGWPTVAAEGALTPAVRLSATLLLLAEQEQHVAVPGTEAMISRVEHDLAADETLDRLRRRRLPWTSATASLALALTSRTPRFDGRRVAIALRGAEQVAASGGGDERLLSALVQCTAWLHDVPSHIHQVREMRSLARQVAAATAPPDLLDLSLVVDGDGWAGPAREAARHLPAAEVAALVRLLGSLGARRPSQAWLRAVDAELTRAAPRRLLREWLELAELAPIGEPDAADAAVGAGPRLFVRGNDDLVRAAALATRLLPEETWVPPVLGALARRGAATGVAALTTDSLSLKVAGAAVDSLVARMTTDDREVLDQLLSDLTRRDLVKRIGTALGADAEAEARADQLRREKVAAVRRKASPEPRRARAGVDVLLRRRVWPVLRECGFEAGGRTWRRVHADRVDVVSVGSSGEQVTLGYGTRFGAAHPSWTHEQPVDDSDVRDWHLDVRLHEQYAASEADLERCATRVREAVVPFLDTLARPELVAAYVEHGAGVPPGARRLDGRPGSPWAHALLGLLLLDAGEGAAAAEHLRQRLAHAEGRLAEVDHRHDRRGVEAAELGEDVAFWQDRLDEALALA